MKEIFEIYYYNIFLSQMRKSSFRSHLSDLTKLVLAKVVFLVLGEIKI